jgi:acyl-CoA thioesterase-1
MEGTETGMRICFIGDSLVNGTGDEMFLGWPGRISLQAREKGCEITLYNLGVRRDTAVDIAQRWEREAKARLTPENDGRVVFSFGTNDCLLHTRGEGFVSEAESITHAAGILEKACRWLPTLMIGPPPALDSKLNARIARFSALLQDICDDHLIPFLSVCDALATCNVWRGALEAGDGFHPNAAGYAVLTSLIDNWVPWREWMDR